MATVATENGNTTDVTMENGSDTVDLESKLPAGVVLPPKEMRFLVEKSASLVARRPDALEMLKATATAANTPAATRNKMQFIYEDSPYYAYFQWRKSECKEGRGYNEADGITPKATKKTKAGPVAPPEFQFSARMPTISAVDLDIVKLTALFVAKNGRQWMTALSQREARNYQFDFLRPQHSFYQFFSRLVDQYTAILTGDSVDGGKPQQARIAALEQNVKDKYHILERARKRAEWAKHQEKQKVKKEEDAEKERIEYAQIDWHEFSVVGTIEFTEADDLVDLPAPTSLNDLQSASLEQKAAMSLAPSNMRLEETMPDMPEFYGYQQPPPAQTPTPLPYQMAPPPQPGYAPSPQPQSANPSGPYAPPRSAQDAEDEARIAERAAERERAQQAQAAAKGTGPMRIRNDYTPRAQQRQKAGNTTLCAICNQQIALDEYGEHVRIEMLDPRWREQARIAAQRSSTTNLSTADVANNLKRLASQRSDVFDPVTGQSLSEEEANRRKRVELSSYDGSSVAGIPGADRPTDVQEQLRLLKSKHGGGT